MRNIDLYPHWLTAEPSLVIRELGQEALFNMRHKTAEYYNVTLGFDRFLPHYGITNVYPDTDRAHIPCRLASHGGEDRKASGDYYQTDRNTGEFRPSFYCHKCQKLMTSFWYVYQMEKDFQNRTLRDVYHFIWDSFRVRPPLELWFNYDAATFYLEDASEAVDVSHWFQQAETVGRLRFQDPSLFLAGLRKLLIQ